MQVFLKVHTDLHIGKFNATLYIYIAYKCMYVLYVWVYGDFFLCIVHCVAVGLGQSQVYLYVYVAYYPPLAGPLLLPKQRSVLSDDLLNAIQD